MSGSSAGLAGPWELAGNHFSLPPAVLGASLALLLLVAEDRGTAYRSIHSKRPRRSCKASFDLVLEDMQHLFRYIELAYNYSSNQP